MPVQQLELVDEPGDHRLHPAHLQPTEQGRCGAGRDLRQLQWTYTWGVDTSGGRTASGVQSGLHARQPSATGKTQEGTLSPEGRARPLCSPLWLTWHHLLKPPQTSALPDYSKHTSPHSTAFFGSWGHPGVSTGIAFLTRRVVTMGVLQAPWPTW